jgi:hypothetical protein
MVSYHLIELVKLIGLLDGHGDATVVSFSNEHLQELCKLLNIRQALKTETTIYNILKFVGFPVDSNLKLDLEIFSYLRWKFICQYYDYRVVWPGFISDDFSRIPQMSSQHLLNSDQLTLPQMPLLHYKENLPLASQAMDEQLHMCQLQ